MRTIDTAIIHCSATPASRDIGAGEIRAWHLDRGWSDIGYHFVIRRDGRTESGRPLQQVGAHAIGHNRRSVGICLVGGLDDDGRPKDSFEPAQLASLTYLLRWLVVSLRLRSIVGHRDLPGVRKACPCFEVSSLVESAGLDDLMELYGRG